LLITGVGISSSSISLLTASLDLELVKLLRGAMNTDAGRATALGPAPNPAPGRGEDRFEPRRVFHPTPRYEPRPVLHPEPRYETRPLMSTEPREALQPPIVEPTSGVTKSSIEPVWKSLPPVPPSESAHPAPLVIKLIHRPPDVSYKGLLLDLFL